MRTKLRNVYHEKRVQRVHGVDVANIISLGDRASNVHDLCVWDLHKFTFYVIVIHLFIKL